MVRNDHGPQVDELLARLPRWARTRTDIRAIALAGSWARGAPLPDSDVDIVVLTESPSRYTDSEEWVAELGGRDIIKTQSWGVITERRFGLPGGAEVEVEVELSVGLPSWADVAPLDEGTRRVVCDGLVALYDPDGLLERLLEACS